MTSLRDRFSDWLVRLRWRWIELTWPQLLRIVAAWLLVVGIVGLFAYWWIHGRSGPEDAESLTADLHNEKENIRYRAYRVLAEREDGPKCFAHALLDDRVEIRREAGAALIHYKGNIDAAIPELIETLEDEDAEVRYRAVIALGKAETRLDEIVLALRRLLAREQDPYVREYAGIILARLLEP